MVSGRPAVTGKIIPKIKWSQRESEIILFVNLCPKDIRDVEFEILEDRFTFKANGIDKTFRQKVTYDLEIDFFGKIDEKLYERNLGARRIEFRFPKQDPDGRWWVRLTKSGEKHKWLSYDYHPWAPEPGPTPSWVKPENQPKSLGGWEKFIHEHKRVEDTEKVMQEKDRLRRTLRRQKKSPEEIDAAVEDHEKNFWEEVRVEMAKYEDVPKSKSIEPKRGQKEDDDEEEDEAPAPVFDGRHPIVKWYQRLETVTILIIIEEPNVQELKIEEQYIYFKAEGGSDERILYEMGINLLEKIEPDNFKRQDKQRHIELKLTKADPDIWWSRLLKSSRKKLHTHIKMDFDHWLDEEEVQEERKKKEEERKQQKRKEDRERVEKQREIRLRKLKEEREQKAKAKQSGVVIEEIIEDEDEEKQEEEEEEMQVVD